jgi:phage shock protein PspC (stress-responsive transcriptional regulator)
MVCTPPAGQDQDMTETQHETTDPGSRGPRVSASQMRDVNRLRRSTTDRKIAGVAGGLGRHFDIDPTIIRVLLVLLVFFCGAGLLLYGAMWLFVPEDGSDAAPIGTTPETRTALLIGAMVVAGLLLVSDGWWMGFGPGWPPPLLPILVVALVVWLVLRHRGQTDAARAHGMPTGTPTQPPYHPPSYPATYVAPPASGAGGSGQPGSASDTSVGVPVGATPTGRDIPPPSGGWATSPPPPPGAPAYLPPPPPQPPARPPRPRSLFGITMAFVLLALGTVAVLDMAVTPLPWAVYPATALAVIGVALVTGAFLGRATGLVFMGLLASGVLALAVWAPELAFGDLDAHPTSASDVQDEYAYTAGRVRLDLTDVQDLDQLDGRTLDLSMRAGEVIVELPAGLDVDVHGTAQGGRLDLLGSVEEGRSITNNQSTAPTGAPDLRIDLDLGFGNARVSAP